MQAIHIPFILLTELSRVVAGRENAIKIFYCTNSTTSDIEQMEQK
jgi:hypothetical protein